jgi:hypothetical protein
VDDAQNVSSKQERIALWMIEAKINYGRNPMTEFEKKMIEIEERKVAVEEKKAEALELLAENVLQGFREHAGVLKKDVAWAIGNVAASIGNLDLGSEKGNED